ncbi:MAG: tetratricopeptide repeat protein [Thermoplasmata archaeon]|nr:tetratricopeptide repeat protein [Thermoplasmata archaeon]
MKSCELCGANVSKKLERCTRCGFEFHKEIRSDARDKAILKKHGGKSVDSVNRDLKNRQAQLTAYLENIAAKSFTREETVSFLDEALTFLQIPLSMGVDDELKFNSDEKKFIELVAHHIESADIENGGPIGRPEAYVRLSNVLQSLGEQEPAMQMIEKALLINPKDSDAMFAKAKLLFRSKNYEIARKCLDKIIGSGEDEKARYLVELIDQISHQ